MKPDIPSDSLWQPKPVDHLTDGEWLRGLAETFDHTDRMVDLLKVADVPCQLSERLRRMANRLDYLDKRMD